MSDEARKSLVAKLTFTDSSQQRDLLDPNITNTWLIAMLTDLVTRCSEPIEILAVRTDHPTVDGHWAHSGGLAADLYPRDWRGREQEAVVDVLRALAQNPYCYAVGLGGITGQWESYVSWPNAKFVVFQDSRSDHIHTDAANAVDGPGDRLA